MGNNWMQTISMHMTQLSNYWFTVCLLKMHFEVEYEMKRQQEWLLLSGSLQTRSLNRPIANDNNGLEILWLIKVVWIMWIRILEIKSYSIILDQELWRIRYYGESRTERMKNCNRVWEPKHKELERTCWVLGYYTIVLEDHAENIALLFQRHWIPSS